MWSYYGSKSKIVKKYPHPKFDTIIEPFAGSARYALLHWENDIILVDKYDAIVRLWKYLQLCSNNDILSLPKVSAGDNLKDIETLSLEEKTLMGFLINPGSSTPKNVVSRTFGNGKMEERVERDKISIASNLHKIKHWKIIQGDYTCLENIEATWFIDPPYQFGGQWYKTSVNNSHIDFSSLADWSRSRNGQVMVCENSKANWMDFKFLSDMSGSKYKTKEVIWTKNK
jgi:site-specific DNA-adenine methylase